MRYSLTIPAPAPWITANDRRHHYQRAAVVRSWRHAGAAAARAAGVPRLDRCHITAYVSFGDRRRRDPLNWADTVKALVDGLVDAGVLADDSARYLVGPDMRLGPVIPRRPDGPVGEVVLHLRETSAAEHAPSSPYASALGDLDVALGAYLDEAEAAGAAQPAALGLARAFLHRRVDAAVDSALSPHLLAATEAP